MPDLNTVSVEVRGQEAIKGTARSMGIEVHGRSDRFPALLCYK